MAAQYLRRMFGSAARALQTQDGSRDSYRRREAADAQPDMLTDRELTFIAARDSLYLATVTEDGWPYVQHRGGPPGFLRHLGGNRFALPDFPGNRQYISAGNLASESRLALFCMDYAARRRLKLIGTGRRVVADLPTVAVGHRDELGAIAAGTILIDVIGFDWNCPQYITPRYTRAEINAAHAALEQENAGLRAELARLVEERP